MTLSRHMVPPLSYSAHRHTTITGIFDPTPVTDTTAWRGAGWVATKVSQGVYSVVLDEAIRYLLRCSARVMASDGTGANPYAAQIVGPGADGKTFTVKIGRSVANGISVLSDPAGTNDRLSFQIECEESTGRIR